MVTFFPTFYPDELFYSAIARYHVRSGNISSKATLKELFGSSTICASVELPSGIDQLVDNLPVGSTLTAEDIIKQSTLYPFYSAFLPPNQAENVYQSIKSIDGKDIYSQSGLMASSIQFNTFFKFCPLCAMSDKKKYGEMYWYRIHQIPGLICVKHGTWLENSKVRTKLGNKHNFLAPNEDNCSLDTVRYVTSIEILSKYRCLVNDIESLFRNNYPHRPLEWFYHCYKDRLKGLGLASITGRVDQFTLQKSFIDYYGIEFLELLQSLISGEEGWISQIVRKHRKSFHPLRHLLFIRFLGLTLDDVFHKRESYQPFGTAPYPCLNVCCNQYRNDVISEVVITFSKKSKELIGTFGCPICGFVYTRRGTDRYKISRVKEFGHVWGNEVNRLRGEQLSFQQIAMRVGTDKSTISNYFKRIGRGNDLLQDAIHDQMIIHYRNEWLLLQKQNPQMSKTQLKKLNPQVYFWLYRNDRAFLDENSPVKVKRVPQGRVDWERRDNEIQSLVQAAVKKLLEMQGKPRRITVSCIGAMIGQRPLLEKHLDKMPMTKELLSEVTETPEQFRLRRIKWAILQLLEGGESLAEWKVFKKAGIRPGDDINLRQIIISINQAL